MQGLRFFRRTNVPTDWNIAAYHDPDSITWSWCLSFRLFRADEGRVWPLAFNNYKRGWTVRVPFVGFLDWTTQSKMLRKSEG